MIRKLHVIPVPSLAVILGLLTLSNIYSGLGFSFFRHFCMFIGTIFIFLYFTRTIFHFHIFKVEYNTPIPASLYSAFMMICMILGSYYFDINNTLGLVILNLSILFHALHIVLFTIKHLIIKRDMNTFIPTWYVVYNGIMVSCVVGSKIVDINILKIITLYGMVLYLVLTPLLILKIRKHGLKENVYQSQTIFVAPCSLCVVSYLNVFSKQEKEMVFFFYGCVFISLIFVLIKLPGMIKKEFHPGFAALTFPMAISTVASINFSNYLSDIGYFDMANIIKQLSGFQVFLTTGIICYVLFKFIGTLKNSIKEHA